MEALLLASCVTLAKLLNLSEAVSSSVNMDNNNNSILRLYDKIIHVNTKGWHSHLLRACEEKRRRKRRGRRGGRGKREEEGKKLWGQRVLGSNLCSTTCLAVRHRASRLTSLTQFPPL